MDDRTAKLLAIAVQAKRAGDKQIEQMAREAAQKRHDKAMKNGGGR